MLDSDSFNSLASCHVLLRRYIAFDTILTIRNSLALEMNDQRRLCLRVCLRMSSNLHSQNSLKMINVSLEHSPFSFSCLGAAAVIRPLCSWSLRSVVCHFNCIRHVDIGVEAQQLCLLYSVSSAPSDQQERRKPVNLVCQTNPNPFHSFIQQFI